MGRFLSPDLVGGKAEDPQTWNRYAYALDNPVKYFDPDGAVTRLRIDYAKNAEIRSIAVAALASSPSLGESGAGLVDFLLLSGLLPANAEEATAAANAQLAALASPIAVSGAALARGGAAPVRLGQLFEEALGFTSPKVRIDSLTGTANFRVPDKLTTTALFEAKNAGRVGLSSQIFDFLKFAEKTGRQVVLIVRTDTRISSNLQKLIDAAKLFLIRLPPI